MSQKQIPQRKEQKYTRKETFPFSVSFFSRSISLILIHKPEILKVNNGPTPAWRLKVERLEENKSATDVIESDKNTSTSISYVEMPMPPVFISNVTRNPLKLVLFIDWAVKR